MTKRILIELRVPPTAAADVAFAGDAVAGLPVELDSDYEPQPVPPPTDPDAARSFAL